MHLFSSKVAARLLEEKTYRDAETRYRRQRNFRLRGGLAPQRAPCQFLSADVSNLTYFLSTTEGMSQCRWVNKLKLATQWMVVLLGGLTLLLSWPRLDSLASVLFFTGALVASTVWPGACGLYWPTASRSGAIAAMLSGTACGLAAYWLIAPYCAAVLSAAVSAVVMIVASRFWPAEFRWSQLQEEA